MKVNYNGKLQLAKNTSLGIENRALRYGDGLFETIRMFEGNLPFWDLHWQRLQAGINYLGFQIAGDSLFYKKEIHKLCGHQANWRIRFSLFRKGGGLYTPVKNETVFLIEAGPLDQSHFVLNEKGLQIDICTKVTLPRHPLSNLKTNNSLVYVLASIFKTEQELDDSILLNDKMEIAEASSSNLFIVKDQKLISPPLSSGCKDGTMRRIILQFAKSVELISSEEVIYTEMLKEADEIWLTNAIQGIKWVSDFKTHSYNAQKAAQMLRFLNKHIVRKKS